MSDPQFRTPGYDPREEASQAEGLNDDETEATALYREVELKIQAKPEILATIGDYSIYNQFLPEGYPHYHPYYTELKNALSNTIQTRLGFQNGSELYEAVYKPGNEDLYLQRFQLWAQLYRHYVICPNSGLGDYWMENFVATNEILSDEEKENMARYGRLVGPSGGSRLSSVDPADEMRRRSYVVEKGGVDLIKEIVLLDWLHSYGNLRGGYINPKRQEEYSKQKGATAKHYGQFNTLDEARQYVESMGRSAEQADQYAASLLKRYGPKLDIYSPDAARENLEHFTSDRYEYKDNLAFSIALGASSDNVYGPSTFLLLPETRENFSESFEKVVRCYIDKLSSAGQLERDSVKRRVEELAALLI